MSVPSRRPRLLGGPPQSPLSLRQCWTWRLGLGGGGRPVVQGQDLNYRLRGRYVSGASGTVRRDGAEARQPWSRGDVT